jgi:prenyltransferase beta subunit
MIPKGSGVDIREKTRDLFARAIPFVMARRKESGGFGATPRLPATVEDTYYALKILDLALQYGAMDDGGYDPFGDESLRAYLSACLLKLPAGAGTRFQLLWCCRSAGLHVDRRSVTRTVAVGLRSSAIPDDWYYQVRILREILGVHARDVTGIPDPTRVMADAWRTVSEAWMRLCLAHMLQCPPPLPTSKLIALFQDSQNGDGGFGFFPGTTSFVENCYASLRALAFLKVKPLDPTRAFRFLAGCQTISGGFGRSSKAAPFLNATWHALAALTALNPRQM